MDDLISRKAAIDLVKDVCDAIMSGCESWYDTETGDEVYKDILEVDAILKCNKEVRIALRNMPSAQRWIPCSERLPKEDHWLGGSGKQFSDNVLISIVNREDEDAWVQVSQTIDGKWALELPSHCKIVAWMESPKPWEGEQDE